MSDATSDQAAEADLLTSDGSQDSYFLAPGYRFRDSVVDFDDSENRARWQDHVYHKAHSLCVQHQCRTVLDIGCGSAFKLRKYFSGFQTTGIEVPQVAAQLRALYPDGTWLDADTGAAPYPAADIYVCSDVIEHIRHPDVFLKRVSVSPFRFLVLSTPAREVLFADGRRAFLGPPDNPSHFFEWTMGEFHRLVSPYFDIVEHSYAYNGEYTQMVVARQKG